MLIRTFKASKNLFNNMVIFGQKNSKTESLSKNQWDQLLLKTANQSHSNFLHMRVARTRYIFMFHTWSSSLCIGLYFLSAQKIERF